MSPEPGPAGPDLTIVETRVYRGPNLWSYDPAIHLVVELGSLEDHPSNTLPGFVDGLMDALPRLARHSCSRGKRGGLLERLKEAPGSATWPSTSRSSCSRRRDTTCVAGRRGAPACEGSTTWSTGSPTRGSG